MSETKRLNENELFALVTTERNAIRYQQRDLPAKQQAVSQAKSQLEVALKELTLVEGAIQGAQISIMEFLAERGVEHATYQQQVQEFLKAEAAEATAKKAAAETKSDVEFEPLVTPDDIINEVPEEMQPQLPVELVKNDDNPDEQKVVKYTKKKRRAGSSH